MVKGFSKEFEDSLKGLDLKVFLYLELEFLISFLLENLKGLSIREF